MTISLTTRRRRAFGLTGAVLGLAVLAAAAPGSAEKSNTARYPYDPACPWGRIANGKGMLVRCIDEQEASALLKGAPPTPPTGEVKPDPDKPEEPKDKEEKPDEPTGPLEVTVGPISSKSGPITVGRLDVPKDRYRECVEQHGGLEGESGEVHVRFLVRGARSRAEGVSVSKRRNLSAEAAKCVADVVDRRQVGTPPADLVAVTLVINFKRP